MAWKEAASLILMSLKERPYSSMYNYQLLMLKRSEKSSFMPSGYVFPGGTVDASDSNDKWKNLFKQFSMPTTSVIPSEKLPPIFHTNEGSFPKDLSLRITAIRETFEETGVLLCRKTPYMNETWANALTDDVTSWRERVQEDPSQFLELCKTLKCVPDIFALKLWSNWLTPPNFPKRFDTVFYTACLPQQPRSSEDMKEIQHLKWFSPEQLYRDSQNEQLWLPPPQFYELSRVLLFCMLEDLAEFASTRQIKGCFRFDAVHLKTKEGVLFPGPGDDLHEAADSEQFVNATFEDLRKQSKKLHRLEIRKNGSIHVVVTGVNASHGHVLPQTTLDAPKQCCKL